MMRKLIYLYIWFFLFADYFSTFWAANGDMSSILELHFMSSVFGQGFKGLRIIFFVEGLLLSALWYLYLKKGKVLKNTYEYRVLRGDVRRKADKGGKFNLIEGIPVFITVLSVGHLIPAINNVLLGLYLRKVDYGFVQQYIQTVHIDGNIYSVHISIGIAALLVVLFFYFFNHRAQKNRIDLDSPND